MKEKMKKLLVMMMALCVVAGISACGNNSEPAEPSEVSDFANASETSEPVELTVLAAASMTDAMQEIGEAYQKDHENVEFVYQFDSSGILKTQIEEGAPADIFISAATKQMDELKEMDMIEEGSDFSWLENKVVLIVSKDSDIELSSFEDVATDKISMVAIGNADVPVGQYTEVIYNNLGLWDEIQAKANLATNVRQVLDWVATGNAKCGIVYATDAQIEENVEVVCEAPEGSCDLVIYPAGMVASSEKKEAAADFLAFLKTEEVSEILESYGFTPYE